MVMLAGMSGDETRPSVRQGREVNLEASRPGHSVRRRGTIRSGTPAKDDTLGAAEAEHLVERELCESCAGVAGGQVGRGDGSDESAARTRPLAIGVVKGAHHGAAGGEGEGP